MRIAITSGHEISIGAAFEGGDTSSNVAPSLRVTRGRAISIHGVTRDQLRDMGETLRSHLDALSEGMHGKTDRDFTAEDRLVLALPGVASLRDLEAARECIRHAGWPVSDPPNYHVIDDTYAGLIAGSLSTRGICALAGTGASVYMGTANGETRPFNVLKLPFKRDGYGPLLGDHGSGFRLAMTTLERICRHFDCLFGSVSPLSSFDLDVNRLTEAMAKRMEESLNGSARRLQGDEFPLQAWFEEIMAERSTGWQWRIASLSEVITQAAEAGNLFAQELVDESARKMFETLDDALRLDDFAELHDATIYCQGGMFRYSPRYLEQLRELLRRSDRSNPVELAHYAPAVGSLLVAVSRNWSIPNDADRDALLEAIKLLNDEDSGLLINLPSPARHA